VREKVREKARTRTRTEMRMNTRRALKDEEGEEANEPEEGERTKSLLAGTMQRRRSRCAAHTIVHHGTPIAPDNEH